MLFKHKEKSQSIPKEFEKYAIEIDSSTCTGEKTIGFRNPNTKELELMEMVRTENDILQYYKKYGRTIPQNIV